jgi:nitrate/nitrite-specific signal transduction histidine kinase
LSLNQLEREWQDIQRLETRLADLENSSNTHALTNYIHLLDSLVESTDRAMRLYEQQDIDQAERELNDAIRIQTYISDTTLQLLDQELKTYDSFYRGMIDQSRAINTFGFWLLVLLVLVLIAVTYLFQRQITHPIHQLTRAANGLSLGNLDQEIQIDSQDELAFLGKTFNRMRENIKQLIHEINEKAKVEKELSESKMLLQPLVSHKNFQTILTIFIIF